jgi:uncharacterized damage-inducible protein DinB
VTGAASLPLAEARRLLAYDAWANAEVMGVLLASEAPPAGAVRFMAHILGAKALWLARIRGEAPPYPVWPSLPARETATALARTDADWTAYFAGEDDGRLARTIEYKNTKGEPWSSLVSDILQHVSFHGMHHRGQAVLEIRSAGGTPPTTDFIHAVRRGLLA